MIKLDAATLRAFRRLTSEQREEVERIVRGHIRACLKEGLQPVGLDRVMAEAVELVEKGLVEEEGAEQHPPKHEPKYDYEVYHSPIKGYE